MHTGLGRAPMLLLPGKAEGGMVGEALRGRLSCPLSRDANERTSLRDGAHLALVLPCGPAWATPESTQPARASGLLSDSEDHRTWQVSCLCTFKWCY